MGVTVDTNVLIDLLEGDPVARERLGQLEAQGHLPVLTTVAFFEVLSGMEYTRSRAERVALEQLMQKISLEPFDENGARRAAELRAELKRLGRLPGTADIMIAGHALASGHILVTRDRGSPGRAKPWV